MQYWNLLAVPLIDSTRYRLIYEISNQHGNLVRLVIPSPLAASELEIPASNGIHVLSFLSGTELSEIPFELDAYSSNQDGEGFDIDNLSLKRIS